MHWTGHLFVIFSAFFLRLLPAVRGQGLRIVGGTNVTTLEYPFIVEIEKYGQHYCGGSLLNERFILTAAHCVVMYSDILNIETDVLRVRVGVDLSSTNGTIYQIQEVMVHPDYEHAAKTDKGDIALLKMTEPIKFGPRVRPISLTDEEPKNGEMGMALGYGVQVPKNATIKAFASSLIRHLQEVELPIVTYDECIKVMSGVTPDMICAGYLEGRKDACSGDSGGPLVVKSQIVGVVAWGHGCAQPGELGVYTNAHFYKSWILQLIG